MWVPIFFLISLGNQIIPQPEHRTERYRTERNGGRTVLERSAAGQNAFCGYYAGLTFLVQAHSVVITATKTFCTKTYDCWKFLRTLVTSDWVGVTSNYTETTHNDLHFSHYTPNTNTTHNSKIVYHNLLGKKAPS